MDRIEAGFFVTAVTSAIVLVAFAPVGDTPAQSSAGNERSDPPPAIEFITPAAKADAHRIAAVVRGTCKTGQEPGVTGQEAAAATHTGIDHAVQH